MVSAISAGHQQIIQVDEHARKVIEDGVHHSMDCPADILQLKGHSQKFEWIPWSDDGGFANIGGCDRHLQVPYPF
jgi:hypothetical protein